MIEDLIAGLFDALDLAAVHAGRIETACSPLEIPSFMRRPALFWPTARTACLKTKGHDLDLRRWLIRRPDTDVMPRSTQNKFPDTVPVNGERRMTRESVGSQQRQARSRHIVNSDRRLGGEWEQSADR